METEKKLAVRKLVELTLRQGSIDNRMSASLSAQDGAQLHRLLQKSAGAGYVPEYSLSTQRECGGVLFTVSGRADGVLTSKTDGVLVDEIKTTLTPLEEIGDDGNPAHMAQAMCYGHMLCAKNGIAELDCRLTYYRADTGEIKQVLRHCGAVELSEFFDELLRKYAKWAKFEAEWKRLSRLTMRTLNFPFPEFRAGQRTLAAAVYRAARDGGQVFAVAPTGIGKTMSTLYPSIKAIGEGMAERVFYLTAKTVTREVARDAARIMAGQGLRAKTIEITAKDKICFNDKRNCNPDACKYADGHYDRVNDAIFETLESVDLITRSVIESRAEKHTVCPFELALDLSLWCDVIICDYNYAFDPAAYLRRFFDDGGEGSAGENIFLIDEAHNLLDRAREMFSAELSKSALLKAKKLVEPEFSKLRTAINRLTARMSEKAELVSGDGFLIEENADTEILLRADRFVREFDNRVSKNAEVPEELLNVYFEVLNYLNISEFYNKCYVTLTQAKDVYDVTVRQYCADPSILLANCFERASAVVAFSATLLPLAYYRSVLGGARAAKTLLLPSPFDRDNLLLLVADNIETKYQRREQSADAVAELIYGTVSGKIGNYLVYFPSYKYMELVYNIFVETYPDVKTVSQKSDMTEGERDAFLARFDSDNAQTLAGFCVLGGVFSEGIDLRGERLIGAVIVGVGLPGICTELNIVRDKYNEQDMPGYDYAYRFPGMNKVLQASGRVIRGEEDRGVVLLIDSRFTNSEYLALFPENWRRYRVIRDARSLKAELDRFWGVW